MVKIENDATYAVDNLNSSFSPNAAIMLATELTELIIRVQVWGMEPLETKVCYALCNIKYIHIII